MNNKALQMGKSSTAGSFYLLIGVVLSSVILALGTLLLAGLLSVDELGLYGIVLIPSTMIAYFRDWGVNSALTQQIACLKAANKMKEVHDVIVSGIIFEIISGTLLSLVCFAVAQPIALILQRPAATSLISLMALSILASALLAAVGSIFVGFEKMKLNSFTQIFQAIIKTALGPLLVFLGFSVLGAVLAAMLSIIATAIVGILMVYFVLFRPLHKNQIGKCDVINALKPMLRYGLPLTISSIVVGVLPLVFTFLMAMYAEDGMMGNYYAASYFSVLITFISFPISTSLFPAFSKLNPETEPGLVRTIFASSVKYTAILLVPTTMVLITLATPLVNTLFPYGGISVQTLLTTNAVPKFPYAPLFLIISSIANLFVLFGNVSLSTFQTGIRKTQQVMKQSLLSFAFGLPFAYLVITYFGSLAGENGQMLAVVGGLVGTIVSSLPGMIWGLIWIWKNYRVKADFGASAKIFASSAIASLTTFIFISLVNVPLMVELVVGFSIFLFVYLTCSPLLGAVNRTDIDNLKTMGSDLGLISKVLNFPLLFMRKICKEPLNGKNEILPSKLEPNS